MLRWEKTGERSLWVVGADGGGEELQGKTGGKSKAPAGMEKMRSKGRNSAPKGIFSPLFLSNAITVLVTATKNLHHPTPALPLRKSTTNFTGLPVGLRVRGTGCMFEAVI